MLAATLSAAAGATTMTQTNSSFGNHNGLLN
jgi:hypothetical protein